MPNAKTKVLLDTNIWRYVIDSRSQGRLLRAARDGVYDIQIAPAVLYEAFRLKDGPVRTSLLELMTNPRFKRLMPEAYSESMEILREVERVRPDWLRKSPDLIFFDRLKKDWTRSTGGFWVRAAKSPEREMHFLSLLEGEMIEGARNQSRIARKEAIEFGWKRNSSMDALFAGFKRPIPGWRGDMVEAWRIDSFTGVTHGLRRKGDAYRDWIEPFVELEYGLLSSPTWLEFWCYLIDKERVPRQWMRWAFSFAQRFRRFSPGSPGDIQLSTYLLDTELLITADKAFIDLLEECRPFAPCQLPVGELLPAGSVGVAELFKILEV